jgi:hypothetical protein
MGASGRSDDDHLEFLNQQFSVGVNQYQNREKDYALDRWLMMEKAQPVLVEELSDLRFVDSWPIKTKCLPLLAGAVQLLDSSSADFRP